MESVEKKVFDALAQASYVVTLGGREFEFRPMSLSDRQEISVISWAMGTDGTLGTDGEENVLRDAIAAGKYARQIAEIISVGAHVRGFKVSGFRFRVSGLNICIPFGVAFEKARRGKLFRYAFHHASIDEVYEAVKHIFINSHPAFFLNIITSLCPKSILTPTRETEATAPGQSKQE